MGSNLIFFYAFAAVAVVSTLLVIAQGNAIRSVLLLIVSFMALAGLYVLLDAPFVAVTQIIVYAGAIMVLFLFVVMLLNVPHEDALDATPGMHESGVSKALLTLMAIAMGAELYWALNRSAVLSDAASGGSREASWSVAQLGQLLFTNYAFAFEATSILILVAMVGAIALAARHEKGRTPNPKSRIPADPWHN